MLQNLKVLYSKIGFKISAVVILFIFGMSQIHFGEKVGLRDGRGWDGVTYTFYTQHFDSLWRSGQLNYVHQFSRDTLPLTHKTNRFLSSMLVHYGLKASKQPFNYQNIIRGFEYQNLIWGLLAVLAYSFLTSKLQFEERDKWLGFFFLFGNFAFLKHDFYNPVNTDLTAYCLMIIQLVFFFYKFHIGVVFTALLGAFVWQPITIYGYFMLLFPFGIAPIEAKKAWIWNSFVVMGTVGLFSLGLWFTWQTAIETGDIQTAFSQGLVGTFGQSPTNMKYFYVSIILAFIFTIFYFGILFRNLNPIENLKLFIQRKFLFGIFYCAILWGLIRLTNDFFSPQTPDIVSNVMTGVAKGIISSQFSVLINFFYNTKAFHKPLEFYIAHITFFGIPFLIAGLYLPNFSRQIRKHGGVAILLIFLASYGGFILNPQSRIGTVLAPVILWYATFVIRDFKLQNYHYFTLILLNLAISKIWYPIGDFIQDFDESYARYFMNWGTWMNLRALIVQGGSFILIALYLIWIQQRNWIKLIYHLFNRKN